MEYGSDVIDAGSRVGVEHDDVVKVGGDAFEVSYDLVDDLYEEPGRGTAALKNDEPFKSRVGVENTVREMLSVSMAIWWNEDTRSNTEKMRPFPRESRTSSTRGMGVVRGS